MQKANQRGVSLLATHSVDYSYNFIQALFGELGAFDTMTWYVYPSNDTLSITSQ
jgi:hypothetical protein